MTLGIDIETFSVEELKQLVLGLQHRLLMEATQKKIDAAKVTSLEMENAVLRDLLARQIVGIVVAPTMISQGMPVARVAEGAESGEEEEAKPVTTDDSEKDKFQA